MKPTRVLYKTIYQTPLGSLSLIADDSALLGAYFVGQKHFEKGYEAAVFLKAVNAPLSQAIIWLEAYFAGGQVEPPKLAPAGTPFQIKVWECLSKIPLGQTVTYGQLTQALDCKSAQAIGGAVGRNPLSLFIPCHRVLGKFGQLTGYAGGLDKKSWLLTHERADFDVGSAISEKK